MLRTQLCDLLQIEFPVIQAGMGPFTGAQLVAAVSSAGGLGSLGASQRPGADLERQLALIRRLTDRPFAVNHLVPTLNQEAFALTLTAKPSIISLALGEPGDLVKRAHDVGILVMQQVHTVKQARQAAEREVDVIIAQGSEAGGFGGTVAALALVPQVVDAVSPIPVVAAGGIADGRGLAAALVLGAQGINVGTRFLAAVESGTPDAFRQAIVAAHSEESVKVEFADHVFPPAGEGGYGTRPRVLETPFVEEWNRRRTEAAAEAQSLRDELMQGLREGRAHELVPFGGQTAGMIRDILPAAE